VNCRMNKFNESLYLSDIETVARVSIGETVIHILKHFNIDIDVETAIRNRDW